MNSTTFRYILIGFWGVLVSLLPFLVSSSLFFPYITGKNIFFRVLVEVLFALWVFSAIYDKSLRPRWGWVIGIFAGFVAWVGIADLVGVDPTRSFWSNFERMEGYITLLHLFALFVISASVMTKEAWYSILGWSTGISTLAWFHGMVEHFGNNITRIDSGFGNPTYFAAYSLLHVFFALLLALRHGRFSYGWGTVALLNVISVYYTGTRGAFLGVLGGLVSIAVLYVIKEWRNAKVRKVSLSVLGFAVVCVIALGLAKNTDFVKSSPSLSRFSELATLDVKGFIENAGRSRVAIWTIASEGVKERPLLGWGQDNFMIVFNTYYTPNIFDQEQWFDRTHNVFFDWLIAAGFPGLIGYLGIFAAVIVLLWKRTHEFSLHERILITGLCVAYFIHTFFVFDSITSYVFIILIWSLVHHVSTHYHKKKEQVENSASYITIGVVVAIALACTINIPVYSTASNLIQGLVRSYVNQSQSNSDEIVVASLEYFKKAADGMKFGNIEVREQLFDATNRIINSNASTSTKNAFVIFAAQQIESYVIDRSNDARAAFFAGIFFNSIGDNNRGVAYLEAARNLSPQKQTIIFQLADTYTLLGDRAKALSLYKEAYESDTSFAEPALRYVQALLGAGMSAEAEKIMQAIPQDKLMEMRYVNLLITTNRYDVIAALFEREVSNNPQNPQLRISLVTAYMKIGKREEAIAVLETLARDVPEARDQMNYFINEIKAGRNPIQ